MRILTNLAAFFLFVATVSAQPVFQEYFYNVGSRPSLSTTTDGDYLLSYNGFDENPSAILRIKPNGDVLSTVEYPDVFISDAQQIGDSTLAIIYSRLDGSIAFGFTDLQGNQYFEKELPCSTEAGCAGGYILPKGEGKFVILYYLDGKSSSNYNRLMLFDSTGTLLGQNDINLNGGMHSPNALRLEANGSITMVFSTHEQAPQKGYIFNYSPTLDLSWVKLYWDTTAQEKPDHRLTALAAAQDGGYLAVGYLDTVAYLLKTDSLANYQWAKTWSPPDGTYTRFYAAEKASDGGFYVAGMVNFFSPVTVVLKIDASGNIIWSTYLNGMGKAIPRSIHLDAAGNPMVLGTTDVIGSYTSHVYLATIPQGASTVPGKSQKPRFEFDILPNPAKDKITLQPLGELGSDHVKLTIRSLEGKAIKVENMEHLALGKLLELDITNLPSGHYFIEIETSGHAPSMKHFVKI